MDLKSAYLDVVEEAVPAVCSRAVITFLIVAFVIFIIVKVTKKWGIE